MSVGFHLKSVASKLQVTVYKRSIFQVEWLIATLIIVPLTIIAIKMYSISFFKSGILLQQPIAPLEGVLHTFEYVLHHPEGNRGREIFDLPG